MCVNNHLILRLQNPQLFVPIRAGLRGTRVYRSWPVALIFKEHYYRLQKDRAVLNSVMMLSAWGFIMVISSFVFMYAGRWIDVRFNIEPTFMIGMLFLGLMLCVFRLYREAVVERTRRIYHQDSPA